MNGIDHLPQRKQEELAEVARILFEEFEAARQSKLKTELKGAKILKIILFGSYARGGWVEDRKSGYRSDYDLLIVVNSHSAAESSDYWEGASERFIRELTITRQLETPVNFIVHSLHEVNDQLARGRPFFIDIARDGIALYEVAGHPLSSPRRLSPEEAREEAQRNFYQWYPSAVHRFELAREAINRGYSKEAAFDLHQVIERLYHCVLQVVTLYSPKSHRLSVLRSHAERIETRLIEAWPRDTKFARRCFTTIDRAYVEARYSAKYSIAPDELEWVVQRVGALQALVADICAERLS
ncbi:HEPN domain-containing protein [Rhizobium sp. BE258]|uniref:HEPN domain-containing protein n=1 Tax=Rhizobium sp. BE258 TaxID=2817722 RepID=UPI002858E951|nr:HEPN domain-containing protein [Rhizobium sp. BE258]MDR7145138.1 putative nucleotidyltransferase/HEPN domain-containing protein [Rhizobium sp. BE258]